MRLNILFTAATMAVLLAVPQASVAAVDRIGTPPAHIPVGSDVWEGSWHFQDVEWGKWTLAGLIADKLKADQILSSFEASYNKALEQRAIAEKHKIALDRLLGQLAALLYRPDLTPQGVKEIMGRIKSAEDEIDRTNKYIERITFLTIYLGDKIRMWRQRAKEAERRTMWTFYAVDFVANPGQFAG